MLPLVGGVSPDPLILMPSAQWLLHRPQGSRNALLCWTRGDCKDDDKQLY